MELRLALDSAKLNNTHIAESSDLLRKTFEWRQGKYGFCWVTCAPLPARPLQTLHGRAIRMGSCRTLSMIVLLLLSFVTCMCMVRYRGWDGF